MGRGTLFLGLAGNGLYLHGPAVDGEFVWVDVLSRSILVKGNARFYDPQLGRFAQADSMAPMIIWELTRVRIFCTLITVMFFCNFIHKKARAVFLLWFMESRLN